MADDSSLPYLADFDSASAMLRALGRFLHGRDFPNIGMTSALKPFAKAVNLLPKTARDGIYKVSGALEATAPDDVERIDEGELARWVVGRYPPGRRYPAVLVGSSNGALVHLAAALGAPWLPQTFLFPVRLPIRPGGGAPDIDDPRAVMEFGREPGRHLLAANPDLQLHHMHDPNQDRLMTQTMTYFRVKRRRLGDAYEGFLSDALEPGGTIFLVDCRRTWRTTRVGERHFFQFGAMGGATEEEYHEGGGRVGPWLEAQGSHVRRWDPPPADGRSPEAEWGFEAALGEDVERLARARGYRLVRIVFEEPEDVSPLVADLYRWWNRDRGLPANRLLVESFILLEPYWTLRTGSVPYWMKFNTEVSAGHLEHYLDGRAADDEPFDEIHLMLFAHGAESIGLPPIDRWRAILGRARREGRFAGVDEGAYPADFAVYARYHDAIKEIAARYPLPAPLALDRLERFLAERGGDRYPVRFERG